MLGLDLDVVTGISGSLEESELTDQRSFYVDEYIRQNQTSPDMAILEQCLVDKPDCVIIMADSSPRANPKPMTQNLIRRMGIPILSIQADTAHAFAMPGIFYSLSSAPEFNAPFADVYLQQDSAIAHLGKVKKPEKYLCLPGPRDGRVFFDGGLERDIGISFVGNIKNHRWRGETIDHLVAAGVDIYSYDSILHGPNPALDKFLSMSDYVRILQRSRMVLGFPFTPWCGKPIFQLKGRPMDVTMCGAMLIEHESPETSSWLEPYVDYVPYKDLDDLVEKTKYYLANESERAAIAISGYRKANTRYNAKTYWETVFGRLGLLRLDPANERATAQGS